MGPPDARVRLVVRTFVLALACFSASHAQQSAREQNPRPAAASTSTRFSADELMDVIRTLASPEFEGRRTGSAGNAKARDVIASRMKAAGLQPLGVAGTFVSPFRVAGGSSTGGSARKDSDDTPAEGSNLVGLCRGTSAADDRAMIVSAHYDHLGVRDGVVYPGADDNASGVAALLALARHCALKPWSHDTVFVAFDAEELGLQGAKAFVRSPPIPAERLAVDINLDMVSRSDRQELFVAGTHHWPALKPPLEQVAAKSSVTLRFGHDTPDGPRGKRDDWTMQSDHGAFHAAGIPFVYFGVEDHADYHRPTDTADKIDREFLRRAAETVLDSVTAIDRALPALRR